MRQLPLLTASHSTFTVVCSPHLVHTVVIVHSTQLVLYMLECIHTFQPEEG